MRIIHVMLMVALSVGCSSKTPPVHPTKLSDTQLCIEAGKAVSLNNAERFAELDAEGDRRIAAKRFSLTEEKCANLAIIASNGVQNSLWQSYVRGVNNRLSAQ